MKNIASKTIQTIVVFGAFVFAGAEAFASDDTTVSVGVNSDLLEFLGTPDDTSKNGVSVSASVSS